MAKQRKIPQRMCSGCGEHKDKKELIRIVKSPDGSISLDLTGKKPGRGAYICPNTQCLAKAKKARRLENAFSCSVSDEVFTALSEEISKI